MAGRLTGKKAIVTESEIEEIIYNDILHMDADDFAGLIEYMYDVDAEYATGDGRITIKPKIESQNLEDIF